VAKKVGIRVERFSIGFPPYVWSRKKGDTVYSIGLIPLGGFVKMAGDAPGENVEGRPDEFMSKTVGQRALTIIAGPFMNYALAIVLLVTVPFVFGLPQWDETRVEVGEVTADSPAEAMGLEAKDELIAVDGEPITYLTVQEKIAKRIEEPIELTWVRGSDTITASAVTTFTTRNDGAGGIDTIGIIGFSYGQKLAGYQRKGLLEAVSWGFITAHVLVAKTAEFIKQWITGEVSVKMVGGPLFIAQQSGREAQRGVGSLFLFMAMLSVNLAVLNILPIPVLDGGHLVFLAYEKLRGRPLSLTARAWAQQVGLILLLALIVVVTYNDILRVLGRF
jgi:regulator of sigma E protease